MRVCPYRGSATGTTQNSKSILGCRQYRRTLSHFSGASSSVFFPWPPNRPTGTCSKLPVLESRVCSSYYRRIINRPCIRCVGRTDRLSPALNRLHNRLLISLWALTRPEIQRIASPALLPMDLLIVCRGRSAFTQWSRSRCWRLSQGHRDLKLHIRTLRTHSSP